MYIRLGNTNINYQKQSDNRYMIVSDIIDSTLSYESPVIVNTKEELDIWFSKNFPERDFLITLLENNVTLYLYKPVDTDNDLGDDDLNYFDFEEVSFKSTTITEALLSKLGDWRTGNFKLLNNNTLTKAEPSEVKNISYKDGFYINDSTNQIIGDVLEVNGKGSIINLNYGEIQKGDTTKWFKIYNSSKKLIKLVINFNSELENVLIYGGNSSKICIKYQNDKAKPTLINENNYKDTIEIDCSKSHTFTTYSTGVYYNNSGVDFSKLIITQSKSGNVDIKLSSENIKNDLFIYCDKSVGSDFRLKLENSQGWYEYAELGKREVWYRVDIENKYKFVITELSDYPGASYYVLGENSEFSIATESDLPTWEGFSIDNDEDLETLKKIKTRDDIKINYEEDFYVWNDDRFMSEKELVQSSLNKSKSLNNRYTLALTTPIFYKNSGISHVYPEYRDSELDHLGVFSKLPNTNLKPYSVDKDSNSVFNSKQFYESDLQSYVLDIEVNPEEFKITSTSFITIKLGKITYVFRATPDVDKNKFPPKSGFFYIPQITSSKNFLEVLRDKFKSIPSFAELDMKLVGKKLKLISKSEPFYINDFYEFKGVTVKANFVESRLLLTKFILNNNFTNCKFYSKIIGSYDELKEDNGEIKVNLENTGTDYYRITISRFDYSEVFEGSLTPKPGVNERLDYTISRESKLVYCEFNLVDGFNSLNTGEFILKNVNPLKEVINNKCWINSLDIMFGNSCTRNMHSDFFLIRDIKKYIDKDTTILDTNYYKEYELLLDYSKKLDFQILIQNSISRYDFLELSGPPKNPIEEVVYLNKEEKSMSIFKDGNLTTNIPKLDYLEILNGCDCIFNYTNDLDNRLLYFYNNIYFNGLEFPGYALFLLSIIKGKYAISDIAVNYSPPGKMTNYYNTKMEDLLDKYKSNYLTFNNHSYYYNKLQNGNTFNTSIYLRFILGKIVRELEKNKGLYIGERNFNGAFKTIRSILDRITNTFNIVEDIEITGFEFIPETNSLNIEIETRVNNLVDKDVTLNITLNLN